MNKSNPQAAITDEEFDEMLETELKILEKVFNDSPDSFMPILTVGGRKDYGEKLNTTIIGLADMSEDIDERHELMQNVGIKMWLERKEHGAPVAVMFSSEAWMKQVKGDKATKDFYKSNKRVSEYDDKEECIVTFGATIDGRIAYALHKFKRNKKGEMTNLKLAQYAPHTNKNPKVESSLVAQFYVGVFKAMKGTK